MNRAILGRFFLTTIFIFSMTQTAHSQIENKYQLPPQDVIDIVDAAPTPGVSFSPDREWMVLIDRDAMPGIEDVARRMLRLAGMRIDPAANGRFQTSYNKGLSLRHRHGDESVRIPLPDGGKLGGTSWSHDSSAVAFTVITDSGQQLWVASVEAPDRPKLLTDRLSTVLAGFEWTPDASSIVCLVVPKNRGDEPEAPRAPDGPNIQESSGNTSPTRTYQDLLANPYDEALFEYYATTNLAVIDVDLNDLGTPGNPRVINEARIYDSVSVSPDGQSLLVTAIKKPFSYLMTAGSFPRDIQVWNFDGDVDYEVASIPLAENIPIEGVRTGPRSVQWKPGHDAMLVWTEALDGGDPDQSAEHRDRFMTIASPFKTEPAELLRVEHRAFGLEYLRDPTTVISTEYDRDRRWVRSLMHDIKQPGTTPKVLMDRSIRDRYGDPGRLVNEPDGTGQWVAKQDGDWVYRTGSGASDQGNLPFIDRQNLRTLETERLWRCDDGFYESVVGMVKSSADKKPMVITARESVTLPPNYYLRNLEDGTETALTDFADPTPQIRNIKKKLVRYERSDGVPLSATLYLPADYEEGTRLPLLVWAYPREFNDVKTAGQISGSQYQFTRMGSISHLTMLTQGYAIMDNATMPVIGDPETMNDTFIDQIVDAAQAAIDKAVELGVADPDRVGVGGHSYGAFMTANLMAHCDLFKAGVARSGAYNRTLTPFGFQSERRTLWEAPEIYFKISPFMHAHKINEPVLLIHGEEDNNSGTFPMQSRRLYQAIKGNGGTVRLVMLPEESHGYRARESVLHTQAEMINWLNKHVKNAPAEEAEEDTGG